MRLFSWQNWLRQIGTAGRTTAKRRKPLTRTSGVESLEARTLLSATAIVKDINTVGDRDGMATPYGYYDNGPTRVGGLVYFIANDGMHGNELWKSDGTAGGTSMVADLTPGPASSEFFSLTAAGERLFFIFDDGVYGHEVWSTDGTAGGTAMVKDISPDGDSLYYEKPSLVAVNDAVFFLATDIVHGQELWTSDGSELGTTMVSDLTPGQDIHGVGNYSKIYGLTASSGKVFFIFDDGEHGRELWMSDGTEGGTEIVLDINDLGDGVEPTSQDGQTGLTDVNGTLYFLADDNEHGQELWKTSGTAETTVFVADLTPGEYEPGYGHGSVLYSMTAAGNQLYFVFDDGVHGYELWTSDGTSEGTVLLKDFNPAGNGVDTDYARVTYSGGLVYFLADDGVHGTELWKTDGTPLNTSMVADLTPNDGGYIYELTDVNGTLFFIKGTDIAHTIDFELWSTDGSSEHTAIVKDINPLGQGTFPADSLYYAPTLVNLNGVLLFQGTDGVHGRELWRSDNTAEGTFMVKNVNQVGFGSVDPEFLHHRGTASIGDTLYFVADDGIHGEELWKSDGTLTGTVMVADLTPGPSGSAISGITALNGKILFIFGDPIHSYELWTTDGTAGGTALVKDINPTGVGVYSQTEFVEFNGALYFLANDITHGRELWKTDGTEVGTVLVEDLRLGEILPGHGRSSYLTDLTPFNGRLYFLYDDEVHGSELWSTDGSSPSTLLKDIGTAGDPEINSLTVVGNTLYFLADDGIHGQELWATNGTEAGTHLVADLIPGNVNPTNYDPFFQDLTASNGHLFFVLDDANSGRELWVSDGSEGGTHLVTDINPNGDAFPYLRASQLTDVDGILYFAANDGVHGLSLWKSNGTEAGTQMVADLPGDNEHRLHSLTNIAGTLYFAFNDGVHGRELWTSDGTSAGTVMVQDINPFGDSVDDYYLELTDVAGTLFFPANDGVHGFELWSDNPPLALDGATFNIFEHLAAGNVLGAVTAAGGNPDAVLTYSIVSESVPGTFAVNPTTGQITVADGSLLSFVAHPEVTLTIRVTDDAAIPNTAEALVTIHVADANDAPTFTIPAELTVLEDAGHQTVSGFATGISAGPSNEAGQTLTFHVMNDNPSLFSVAPAISSTGELTYTLAPNANGAAHVSVSLTDNGGVDHGGDDSSAPTVLLLTVTAVNDAPSFTLGGNQTVLEDATAQIVNPFITNISAGAADESAQTLSFLVVSSNEVLFSVQPSIDAAGVLRYTLAANANGVATVTVILSDNGGGTDISVPQPFLITATAVNDAPTFTVGENQTVLEDASAQTVNPFITNISAGAADESGQTLTFLVDNNNHSLFTAQPSISGNGTLTYTLVPNANGLAVVTVTLQDNGDGANTSVLRTFTINATPVNDAPSYSLVNNAITVLEDAGPQTVPGFASSLSKGPANESEQTLSFTLENDNPNLFLVAPAISPTGELTYTLNPNANGLAHVALTLRDNGGSDNGGNNEAPDGSFTIEVTPVNDAPDFSIGTNLISLQEDAVPQSIAGFASNLSKGSANESEQTLTFMVVSDNTALFSVPPAINAAGELTYTLAPNANGTAHVTVSLRDNGGTANGGVDSAADATFTIEVMPVDDPIDFPDPPADPPHSPVGTGRTLLDPGLSVGDADNPVSYVGSKLTVDFNGPGEKTDFLTLPPKKGAVNGVAVKGRSVLFNGLVVGTVAGGAKGTPLNITFGTNASQDAVNAVLRSIGFGTRKNAVAGTRTVHIVLQDANGHVQAETTRQIEVEAA